MAWLNRAASCRCTQFLFFSNVRLCNPIIAVSKFTTNLGSHACTDIGYQVCYQAPANEASSNIAESYVLSRGGSRGGGGYRGL